MRSWIVAFWERAFGALSWVSLFQVLRRLVIKPLSTAGGVEIWVMSHLALAFVAAVFATIAPSSLVVLILVYYGLLRVFEIVVYQTNVLLFDQIRSDAVYALEGYTRIVLLLLQNCFEIIFWFAAAYGVLVPQVGDVPCNLPRLMSESFATFTGFGSAHLNPTNNWALAVVWAESAVGLFMSIVVLARFIGILPKPRSKTPRESNDN